MKGFIAAAIMLAGLTAPAVGAKFDITRNVNYPKTVAGQVIVELAPGTTIGARDLENVDVHARFFEELDRRLPNKFTVGKKFSSEVFTGATLTLKSLDDVKAIAATKGVINVRPVSVYDRPEVIKSEVPKLSQPDQFPPNIMTGADKIHATGNIGAGIKVGIIDSGVDYTHPALGGGFGPGFKVAGGTDFVGDDYVPGATPVPDDDPIDQCGGHGTHVAGIIAADPNNPFNITGVAHGATLNAYRIFGCGGGVTDDIIVDSLIRAYKDGNDVITLSLGGLDGWTASSSSVVASRIARAGRVVTIAAGNSGAEGLWYTSSPGNGIDVISVGSVDNIAVGPLYTVTTTAPGLGPFPYQWDGSIEPLAVGDIALPLYATSKDPTVVDDACSALPDSTPDLSGYVTLIRRGTCNFTIKIQNAVSKGAKVILLYNNGGNWGAINVGGYQYAAIVDTASGEALLAAYNAGTKFTVSFPQDVTTTVPNVATGGLVSTFSSYGPTYDMYFKPAVSAPGGQILGTYPVPLGSYAVLSGTSMATPHTAGIAALILKARGKSAAKGIRDLLQTTSTYLSSSLEEGAIPQTLAAGGAGLANVYNALTYTTVVSPGQLLLNDTANWNGIQVFTIKNTGKKVKTYTLKHIPAATANSLYAGTIQPQDGPVELTDAAATVKLSLTKAIVLPGTSLPIIVNVQPPKGVDASVVPVISGHIEVATAGEILKVSYLGAATDLKKVQIIDNAGDLIGVPTPLLIDAVGNIQEEATDYTFVGEDYPLLIFRLVFGTRKIAVDLVKGDATIPTNLRARSLPFNDWLQGLIHGWFPSAPGQSGTYSKVPIVGKLSEYEYLPRNNNADDPYYQVAVPGAFINGTAIPVGSYKVLVRALKVGGNAANQDHYETWLSPVVNVVAA